MERREMICNQGWFFVDADVPDGELLACDTGKWNTVSLPHDWAVTRPLNKEMAEGGPQGFLDRWGVGWYRMELDLEEVEEGRLYLLTFEGIYEQSRIWVNEQLVGEKLYGYSGFTLDITKYIHKGRNLLAVRVDNTHGPVDRWYSGAGIYRNVKLETVYNMHFNREDIVVESKCAESGACFAIHTGLSGMRTRICLKDGAQVLAATETDTGEACLSCNSIQYWSAETPYLYHMEFKLLEGEEVVDCLSIPVGVRQVDFLPKQGMLVNGQPVKLKGVCLHHDGGCVGSAVTKSLWRQRLELLKSMGCNSIRTSHNIPSGEFMDLCDEMGFYVLEESFDKWVSGAYGRYFETQWETDLSYMVKRDRNRPSVIMWSVGNEVENQGMTSMAEIMKRLVTKVKGLDGSRPVTCAFSPHYTKDDGVEAQGMEELVPLVMGLAEHVDILSLNYQEQWYEDFHKANPDKLILGTETYLFFRGSRDHYFNYSTEHPWLDVERNDYVLGGFLWAGIDYLGESMGYPSKGWCGAMIKTNLERKPISWLFESYWSEEPVVHLTMLDYSLRDDMAREHWAAPPMSDCWNFPMYQRAALPYMIFSNCEEVRLYLNGKELDIKNPDQCESRIITGYIPIEKGAVTVKGFCKGREVCRHELVTAGPAAKLEFQTDKAILSLGKNEQFLVTVCAKDDNGTICRRESTQVRLVIEGPGIIEGVDNGDLMGTEPYGDDRMHMMYGAVSAVVRTTSKSGRIVVTAYADGLLEGRTELIYQELQV